MTHLTMIRVCVSASRRVEEVPGVCLTGRGGRQSEWGKGDARHGELFWVNTEKYESPAGSPA